MASILAGATSPACGSFGRFSSEGQRRSTPSPTLQARGTRAGGGGCIQSFGMAAPTREGAAAMSTRTAAAAPAPDAAAAEHAPGLDPFCLHRLGAMGCGALIVPPQRVRAQPADGPAPLFRFTVPSQDCWDHCSPSVLNQPGDLPPMHRRACSVAQLVPAASPALALRRPLSPLPLLPRTGRSRGCRGRRSLPGTGWRGRNGPCPRCQLPWPPQACARRQRQPGREAFVMPWQCSHGS